MLNIPVVVRHFLPENFTFSSWADIEPFFKKLLDASLNDASALNAWLKNRSELEAFLEENMAWRYIRMTGDTTNSTYSEAYQFFVNDIMPHISPAVDALNKKLLASAAIRELNLPEHKILIRGLEKEVSIFRNENIPLLVELQNMAQEYSGIIGAMSVEIRGENVPLPKAAVELQSTDRTWRQEVFEKIQTRRNTDAEKLDELFNKMIETRHQVALNAGFESFTDYMFVSLGRFDYTKNDCHTFHQAIEKKVVPLVDTLAQKRKNALQVSELKPFDMSVDTFGRKPLKAFQDGKDLLSKSIACFGKTDAFLAECLELMERMGHFDLESRNGKAPGGYNYPLSEIGIPFIFMNATSTVRDMVTLMHEGGHAVHSIVTKDLPLVQYKSTPSEVAELASMSMELISMDHWDEFFPDKENLKRAKLEHLESILETLPWVATIDKFQHWIYQHPTQTSEERAQAWLEISRLFRAKAIDWSGYESFQKSLWHKQLHIFEVPFYYIEYGIAQLGAISVWKNYKENPQKGLQQYLDALKLGYTRDIATIYKTAGVAFDFSEKYIGELMAFVEMEMEIIEAQ